MALNVYDLASLLFAYSADAEGATAQVEDPLGEGANPLEIQWVAVAITAALQEMQRINPGAFELPVSARLSAPVSGTITVGSDLRSVTLGTLVPPPNSSGSTVRVGSDTDDNVLYMIGDGPSYNESLENDPDAPPVVGGGYELQTPASTAGVQGCTLYHDCWPAANGVTYEQIMGDVRVNGQPIGVAKTRNDLWLLRYGWDYGNHDYPRRAYLGEIRAVWVENFSSPIDKRATSRLRFAPIPTTECVVTADIVPAAQKVTTADIVRAAPDELPPDVEMLCPKGLHESILLPFALKHYLKSPWFRTASARDAIMEDYKRAKDDLLMMRGSLEQQGELVVIGH